jgi:hypothetical protein
LELIQMSQRSHLTHQITGSNPSDRETFRPVAILGSEEEVSVGGVKGNLNLIPGPATTQDINLPAHGYCSHITSFAKPSTLAQIAAHTTYIERISLPLWTIGTAWRPSLRMRYQGWNIPQTGTRKMIVKEVLALLQRVQEGFPAFELLPFQDLVIPGLMAALGDGLILGTVGPSKPTPATFW